MAEYMDIARIDDWNDLSIIDDNGYATFVYDVGELPRADVVERSEYEKLRLINLDLAEINKGLLAEHEQLEKLRSKINAALEEIEKQEKIIVEYEGESDLGVAIRIIKEQLGE